MGKHEVGTPKYIANKIKAKGLQKLRWYCQMCQKQCRDENGFKCHTMSESHQRQLLIFADNSHYYIDEFSKEFADGYLELLRRQFGTKRVPANKVYQDYISDRHHLHMNSTRWETLTEFVKWLGREGKCMVDETEKGWFVAYIDRDPETIALQEALAKKEKMQKNDDERMMEFLEKQIEKGKKDLPEVEYTELKRENEDEKIKVDIKLSEVKPASSTIFLKPSVPLLKRDKLKVTKEKLNDIFPSTSKRKSALDDILREEEIKKEKRNRKDYWLCENIVAKVVTKTLGDKYYKKKGVVESVKDKYVATVRMIEGGDLIKLDQEHLETVIPSEGRQVKVVNGAYRGQTAILKEIHQDKFCATLEIACGVLKGRIINSVQYEDFKAMDFLGDDSGEDTGFNINSDYANRYDKWRRGEVIQKLKDKYGDTADLESSSSEDEDENAVELTKDKEKQFFKTLSCLKVKHPKIYDASVRFFDKREDNASTIETKKKQKSEATLTVGEYQRKQLLDKGGYISDQEEKPIHEMSNAEQERAIKESFKDVLKDSESEDDGGDWGGLFQKRKKTKEELQKEEDDYRDWLAGEREKLNNVEEEAELKGLHDYWTDPKLDEGERFLRDYILNRRYLEKDDKTRIPSYDEIVHDSDSGLSADEDMIKKQDEFEKKYNFRFEEPDQEFIKHYPRTMENSMRKKDDKRKRHREELKTRKEAEKAKKNEELKRLKSLKKKEIMEKIKKLQEITGNEDMGFQNDDLEEDFDPEKHDQRMSSLFNEDYYGAGGEEEKPEYPDLDEELEIENWDEWTGYDNQNSDQDLHCEDPGFNMDCDYDPQISKRELQNEMLESSKTRKNKRKQSKFAAAVAKKKPLFDPKNKSFEKYLDEYYSLDYEDLIGDIPCRFKYRKTVPNDFGLSVEEILTAPDRELNSWASVKKIMQRRPDHIELYDVKAYQKKATNFTKKIKCLPSLYSQPEPDGQPNKGKKRKRKQSDNTTLTGESTEQTEESKPIAEGPKKKKKKKKPASNETEDVKPNISHENKVVKEVINNPGVKRELTAKGKKKRKNKNKNTPAELSQVNGNNKYSWKKKNHFEVNQTSDSINLSDGRLKSYGINPKKFKKKERYFHVKLS